MVTFKAVLLAALVSVSVLQQAAAAAGEGEGQVGEVAAEVAVAAGAAAAPGVPAAAAAEQTAPVAGEAEAAKEAGASAAAEGALRGSAAQPAQPGVAEGITELYGEQYGQPGYGGGGQYQAQGPYANQAYPPPGAAAPQYNPVNGMLAGLLLAIVCFVVFGLLCVCGGCCPVPMLGGFGGPAYGPGPAYRPSYGPPQVGYGGGGWGGGFGGQGFGGGYPTGPAGYPGGGMMYQDPTPFGPGAMAGAAGAGFLGGLVVEDMMDGPNQGMF